jgi:hypothetical protein
MKKKLLVLLITAASTLMPNFASAVAIELPEPDPCKGINFPCDIYFCCQDIG